jgi:hypothetical protein
LGNVFFPSCFLGFLGFQGSSVASCAREYNREKGKGKGKERRSRREREREREGGKKKNIKTILLFSLFSAFYTVLLLC